MSIHLTDPLSSAFSALMAPTQVAACRDTCVPDSTEPEMLFTTGIGIYSFDTEANIGASCSVARLASTASVYSPLIAHPIAAYALETYGAMWCAFDVYESFFSYSGGVYMGAEEIGDSEAGGHAIVVYGWGTTDDGVPYWKCINCAPCFPVQSSRPLGLH